MFDFGRLSFLHSIIQWSLVILRKTSYVTNVYGYETGKNHLNSIKSVSNNIPRQFITIVLYDVCERKFDNRLEILLFNKDRDIKILKQKNSILLDI